MINETNKIIVVGSLNPLKKVQDRVRVLSIGGVQLSPSETKENKYTSEDLKVMQAWDLNRKIQVTQTRLIEWYKHYNGKCYVSFSGGKDSTVMAYLAAQVCNMLGYKLTLWFSNTGLEYSCRQKSLIYCDIPYKNTKQYNTSLNFDHDHFWSWAREMSAKNIVIVSEYEAPAGWDCIWSKKLLKTMNHGKNVNSTEKLFIYGGD